MTAVPKGGLMVRDLRARHRHGPEVVCGVDLHAPPGEIVGLLGPNGAGKSTLLKAMVGLLPYQGSVTFNGENLAKMSDRDRARKVAYVPQRTALTARLTVRSVVDLGRFAHRAPWSRPTARDLVVVQQALIDANVLDLASRPFPTLSGGEQQRVLLARALATEAPVLLLDEPTSALDVRQALLLHAILRKLAKRGVVIVVVLHDLAEVRQHTDRAVLLREGRVHASGLSPEVVSAQPISEVYGVELVEQGGLSYRLPKPHGRSA